MKNKKYYIIILVMFLIILSSILEDGAKINNNDSEPINSYSIESIPEYNNEQYIYLNENKPNFKESDYLKSSFEQYSDLDTLGRSGVAYANIGIDLMPTTKRNSIGMIKPSGWHTVKYDIINGKYLYNRCHLIAYQLTGENANSKNLITCTHQMNSEVMVEFENEVAKYIKQTNNHVLYRVTPFFEGNSLLAKGVQIEASSVEDRCKDICFNIFIYNVQDGIHIDYLTGESKLKQTQE